ncbi:hypothetical protein TSUD_269070 [Trifolium subterraneum]|uniref:Uncharacterized protein n=1 Tax=Trifolium subterraneum TaxID=3900 RepID=A0A2Z6NG36_TRISU|nr:hypothetical protein TSUD_269070 [Trifolium subterraneum]
MTDGNKDVMLDGGRRGAISMKLRDGGTVLLGVMEGTTTKNGDTIADDLRKGDTTPLEGVRVGDIVVHIGARKKIVAVKNAQERMKKDGKGWVGILSKFQAQLGTFLWTQPLRMRNLRVGVKIEF